MDQNIKTEQRFQKLIAALPGSVFIVDKNNVFVYTNIGCENITERLIGVRDVIGKCIFDVYPLSTGFYEHLLDLEKRKVQQNWTTTLNLSDGEIIYRNVTTEPLFDEFGELNEIIILSNDVTEEIRNLRALEVAKQAAEKAKEKADRANTAKTEFLSKISHELRTPLNAIIGMINITSKATTIEKVHSSLAKMHSASQNLLQTINDVLDISKISAGKMELYREQFDFEHMLRNIFDVLEFAIYQKHIKINADVGLDFPRILIGDGKRLSQVFMNLLSNAVKFTGINGTISVDVKHEPLPNNRIKIIASVKDSGIGIPQNDIPTLFMDFIQLDNTLSRQHTGTGLGLAIAKNILHLMNGEITVTSTIGVGTKFEFSAIMEVSTEQEITKISSELYNILVIDDSEETCEYLDGLLSSLKIKHGTACSGSKGIQLAKESIDKNDPYNIILLDYSMPDMDGIETAAQLKEIIGDNSMIIMISSFDWLEIESKAQSVGIYSYLTKPLMSSMLVDKINNVFKKLATKKIDSNSERFNFSGKTALLFEDVEINREIVSFLLEESKITIDEACDGIEGLDKYFSNPEKYDIIFMDIQMPRMDGFEATRQIRSSKTSNAKTIPIVAMTANAFEEHINASYEVGMNAHITKPLNENELKDTISNILFER